MDYEETRQKNIEENKAFLKDLMKDFEPIRQKRSKSVKSVSSKRHSDPTFVARRNPSRSSRNASYAPYFDGPRTRSQSRRNSESYSESSSNSSSPSKDGARSFHLSLRFLEHENDEDEYDVTPKKKRRAQRSVVHSPRKIRPPEDIGDDEIQMVADHVKEKSYDQALGRTCHQCRQKTIDMKTICRNEECVNATRGQFCGPCLRNRYGEEARDALKDPDWFCPPCRGICNCSICRRKSGKGCTGILVHLAKEEGYNDVSSYLLSFKKK